MENMENRIGNFEIKNIYNHNFDDVVLLLKDIVILRAEHMLGYRSMHYTGVSKLFEKMSIGSIPPDYDLKIKCDDKGRRYVVAIKK